VLNNRKNDFVNRGKFNADPLVKCAELLPELAEHGRQLMMRRNRVLNALRGPLIPSAGQPDRLISLAAVLSGAWNPINLTRFNFQD